MKRIIRTLSISFFLLFLLIGPALPQGSMTIVGPDIPFLGMEKIVKDIKRSVFAVQMERSLGRADRTNVYAHLGTGFLLERNKVVIGITCNHVITPAHKMKKSVLIGLDTGAGYQRFECIIAKQDIANDIAVLLPKKPTPSSQILLTNLVLNKDYLADKTTIVEGRGIIIPGYPLGLGLEHDENHPVIKLGIVAQYSGREIFLIDGVANPGNSGSPVFDLYQKKFIGMVQSYRKDFIDLFDKDGSLVAKLPYNSGLSNAVSSGVILKVIEELELPK